MKLLYNCLILSRFDYGLLLWGKSAKCNVDKIQKLQNRYARLILNADFLTSSNTLLSRLKWQSISERVQYQFRIWMYKTINNKMPNYIQNLLCYRTININTRHATSCPFYIDKHRTEYFKRSFHYQGSTIWNNLPLDSRNTTSLESFKKHCKLISLSNP